MSELIRRQDAEFILAREMYATSLKDGCDPVSPMDFLPEARAWLSDAPTIGGWIPCSEKLPEIKEYHTSDVCLCYCSNGAYCFGKLEENIFGQVGWNCERDDDYHEAVGEVIAWMELPPAYKEETDE